MLTSTVLKNMSVHESSENFENEMIHGWLDGLQELHCDNVIETRHHVKIWGENSQDVGDIDAQVTFMQGVPLRNLFPPASFQIRPLSLQQDNPKITGIFAEFKQLLSNHQRVVVKIKQFVQFYTKLFAKSGLSLNHQMRQAIDDCGHLFFVFNGEDSVNVETVMRNELGLLQIAGRPVILVWANSTEICTWGSTLRQERQLLQMKGLLDQSARRIAQLERENLQLKSQLSKKRSSEEMDAPQQKKPKYRN